MKISAARAAMISAALTVAQQVAGKAVRDAAFLSQFPVSRLPTMLVAGAVLSILAAFVTTRLLSKLGPRRALPLTFAGSALVLVALYLLSSRAPRVTAVLLYLHVSSLGTVLVSGFWSLVTEGFDPHTARHQVSRIGAGAAAGGVLGGVCSERLAAGFGLYPALLLLAALHLAAALGVRLLAARLPSESTGGEPLKARAGLKSVQGTRYLGALALLVVLVTLSGTLLDYVMKARAASAFTSGADLLRFFALFHTGVGLFTFVVQSSLSKLSLERWGLTGSVASVPLAVLAGGVVVLLLPTFANVAALRGLEAVLRNSLFRSGYELYYTPLSAADKRTAKPLIDVGFDRLADALGGGTIRGVLFLMPVLWDKALLGAAAVLSLVCLLLARRLGRGYVAALERSLLADSRLVEHVGAFDRTTLNTLHTLHERGLLARPEPAGPVVDIARIEALTGGDSEAAHQALSSGPAQPALLAFCLPWLGRPETTRAALRALRPLAERCSGQLIDALLDPALPLAVRQRLPRVLSACSSQRALNGLTETLSDPHFAVRAAAAQAIARIVQRVPALNVRRDAVVDAVLSEARIDKATWRTRELTLGPDDQAASDDGEEVALFGDASLGERRDRGLEHLFTLFSLILPREPLVVAFQALHTENDRLRGTALEYLDSALPEPLREPIGGILGRLDVPSQRRASEEAAQRLLELGRSITIELEALSRRVPPKSSET